VWDAVTSTPHLLDLPHADGSPAYVSTQHPALGEIVELRVWVPRGFPASRVFVRHTPDGEGTLVEAVITSATGRGTWWAADVEMVNPVLSYRWLFHGGPTGYAWLNGTGVHHRDVPDAANFRLTTHPAPPDWSRDAVVYQIFPDRFARSAAADDRVPPSWAQPQAWDAIPVHPKTGLKLYGGDLDGIVEHLDHIASAGFTAIYLTPFFPAGSTHRYDATSFDHVDDLLGGDDALVRLVRACHDRGIHVVGDFTTNHTGSTHEWFRAAQASPTAPERDFYFFDADGRYGAWLGVTSLPKLNHASTELRRRLFDGPTSAVGRWLVEPFNLDGWRVDVANMTGRYRDQDLYHDVAREMRRTLDDIGDKLLVGEHFHDSFGDIEGDGWHGLMNYGAFTRPLWSWLRGTHAGANFMGNANVVPPLGGADVVATMRDFASGMSWVSLTHSLNLAGSHDTSRILSLVGGDIGRVKAAAGLVNTMPGIPMVTYGDEIGMAGDYGENGRRTMPWDDPTRWNADLLAHYTALAAVRREHPSLRTGSMRWVLATDDVIAFVRTSGTDSCLVVATRASASFDLVTDQLPGVEHGRAVIGEGVVASFGRVEFHASTAGVTIWSWTLPQDVATSDA